MDIFIQVAFLFFSEAIGAQRAQIFLSFNWVQTYVCKARVKIVWADSDDISTLWVILVTLV